MEFVYDTQRFPDFENWVYSIGDPTGYGLHGELIAGWTNIGAADNALRTCSGDAGLYRSECSITHGHVGVARPHPLDVPAPAERVGQNGPVPKLPGNNPIRG